MTSPADFGFRPAVARVLSGTLWNDLDADGVIDPGEGALAGITVDVRDAGGNVVRTVTTDASGAYSVDGLAAAAYTVWVTDTSALLTGYNPTYEVTGGTAGPFNSWESANLVGGNLAGINFGYRRPAVTYASISAFRAFLTDSSVTVEWHTSLEIGTLGFHLLRFDPPRREVRCGE